MIWVGVADDHAMVRTSLRRFLEFEEGIAWAGEAADGEEAIMLAQTRFMNVLVLDLSMPGLSGLAAMPRIRAAAPDLSIIVLTGYAAAEISKQVIAAGACAILEKPCEPAKVVAAIRRCASGPL